MKELLKLVVPAPRRPQIIQYYSSQFWDSRIEAQFQVDWVAQKERLVREGKEVPSKPPVDEKLRTARNCWDREDAEFREAVVRQRDEEHEREKAEYERVLNTKKEQGKGYDWSVVQ